MSKYKSPSLLNTPLIVVMAVSVLLPIATYFFYYTSQVATLEDLHEQRDRLTRELVEKHSKVSTRDAVLADIETAQALVDHFKLRFFRSRELAERFLKSRENELLRNIPNLAVAQIDTTTAIERQEYRVPGELANLFTDVHIETYRVAGTHVALNEFLRTLYGFKKQVRYPRAVYVQATLPEAVQLPDFNNAEERAEILRDLTRLPLFFERDAMATDPSGRTGRVWFLCRPRFDGMPSEHVAETRTMTDDQLQFAIGMSTNEHWRASMQELKTRIDHNRPMVPESIHFDYMVGAVECTVTGLRCEVHEVSPFFYIDRFSLEPSVRLTADRHILDLRVVIPIWDEEKVQAYLADAN